ncbi:MAG: hypothetical protein ABI351_02360 [Herbaspirillum sp.]
MAAGMIAGGAIGGIGALMSGQSQYDSLNAQADLQQKNAQEALAQGQFNANKSALQSGQRIGDTTAAFGAGGVRSNSGSVMAVLGASAANAELDRLNILHGADMRAINYQNEASMERVGAQNAKVGSYFSAFGSVAGAGARAYSGGIGNTGALDNASTGAGGPYAGGDSLNTGNVA